MEWKYVRNSHTKRTPLIKGLKIHILMLGFLTLSFFLFSVSFFCTCSFFSLYNAINGVLLGFVKLLDYQDRKVSGWSIC
jgi:hypothetical protein